MYVYSVYVSVYMLLLHTVMATRIHCLMGYNDNTFHFKTLCVFNVFGLQINIFLKLG